MGIAIVMAASMVPVSLLVNSIVPHPYMGKIQDEIFHIPQAQEYCQGNFRKWDPMITTFPGLYFVSLAYTGVFLLGAKILGLSSSLLDLCTPAFLRSINVVFSLLCYLLFVRIMRYLEPDKSLKRVFAKATLLAFYPLHWFFAFLYYTDVGSTTAVMAMHLACLQQAHWISALLGAVAILFRQTNVIWVIFVTCTGLLEFLHGPIRVKPRETEELKADASSDKSQFGFSMENKGGSQDMKLRRRMQSSVQADENLEMFPCKSPVVDNAPGIGSEIWSFAKQAWLRRWEIFKSFGPLICIIILFFLFVCYNGSIVVGAKDAHKVSPHFAQLLYFGLISAAAMAPVHFQPSNFGILIQEFLRPQFWVLGGIGSGAAFVFVHYFSLAHPYLLADNRHYTFYLWKDVIQHNQSAKYCLIPLYVYSWWSILHSLGRTQGRLWILVFCLGIMGVLVPAPLLEFRYFTIPFFLIALHTKIPEEIELGTSFCMTILYLVLNAFTMYLFLFRPFHWANDPGGIQRFMW
ncbi:unnamed protein product [Sphagnum compactum]